MHPIPTATPHQNMEPSPMSPEEKKEELAQIAASIVADIKSLFGAPPLLSTEDPTAYDRILFDLVKAGFPHDFLEKMFLRDVANAVWFDLRLDRHARVAMDRKVREMREFEKTRLQQNTEISKAKLAAKNEWSLLEKSDEYSDEEKRKLRLEAVIEDSPHVVDDALDRAEAEDAHSRALEKNIGFFQTLDELKSINLCRRNVSLQLRKEHKFNSYLPAYMHRKEHEERAQVEQTERDARIDALIAMKTQKTHTLRPPLTGLSATATDDEYGPRTTAAAEDAPQADRPATDKAA